MTSAADLAVLSTIKHALTQTFSEEIGNAFEGYVLDEYEGDTMIDDIREDLEEDTWEDSQLVDGLKETVDNTSMNDDAQLEKAFLVMRKAMGILSPKLVEVVNPFNFNNAVTKAQQITAENFLGNELFSYAYDQRDVLFAAGLLRSLGINNRIPSLPVLLWDTFCVYRCEHAHAQHQITVDTLFKNLPNSSFYAQVTHGQHMRYLMEYWIEPKGFAPKLQFNSMTLNGDCKLVYAHYAFAMNRVIQRLMRSSDADSNSNSSSQQQCFPLQLDVMVIPSHCTQKIHSAMIGGSGRFGRQWDDDDDDDDDEEELERDMHHHRHVGGFSCFEKTSYEHRYAYPTQPISAESDMDSSDDNDDRGVVDGMGNAEHIYGKKTVLRRNEYITRDHVFEADIFGIRDRLRFHGIQWSEDVIHTGHLYSMTEADINRTASQILAALEKCARMNHSKSAAEKGRMFCMKRYVILIDRRICGWQRLLSDELLVYYAAPWDKLSRIPDPYCEELLLQMSKECLLPSLPAIHHYRHYGGYQDLQGHMHMTSYHIHNPELIRMWWYINGSVTRWFPEYMHTVWPFFFMHEDENNDEDTASVGLQTIRNKIKFPYKDDTFDAWYRITVKGEKLDGVPVECIGTADCYQAT